MSKNTRTRILLTAVAALLLVVMAVGGTMAWLVDTSDPVTNTFTPSGLEIKLEEHDYDPATNALKTTIVNTNTDYQIVPSVNLPKDPFVTFSSDVDCYVFIKVEEENWPTRTVTADGKETTVRLMDYTLDGWTAVPGVTGVYYKEFAASETAPINGQVVNVITDKTITVRSDITVDEMKLMTKNPQVKFTAYIIQKANGNGTFTPAAAWAQLNP